MLSSFGGSVVAIHFLFFVVGKLPIIGETKLFFIFIALLVMPNNIGNVEMPRIFQSIVTILANSASKITELEVNSLFNLALHFEEGIVFPALKQVYLWPISDADLVNLANAAPNLQLIDIDIMHPRSSDAGLAAIIRCCPHVETFRLSYSHHVVHADEGLAAIAMCPKLQVICLGECTTVGDTDLTAVVTHCTQLEELIVESPRITDAPFVSLAHSANAKTMKCLVLNTCSAVTGTGIVAVATHCPILSTLNCYRATSLTIDNMKLAIPHLQQVICLSIDGLPFDDEVLQLIAEHIPHLHNLGIAPVADEYMFTSTGLMHIAMKKCEAAGGHGLWAPRYARSSDSGRGSHLLVCSLGRMRCVVTFCFPLAK